jgi:DNA-binding NarL/FixJ family response regulator
VAFTGLGILLGRRLSGRGGAASAGAGETASDRPTGDDAGDPVGAPPLDVEALRAAWGISARQYDVLRLLADGCSNEEIARHLHLSPNTVKTHLSQLYARLEVSRRTQAVRRAREAGLIT